MNYPKIFSVQGIDPYHSEYPLKSMLIADGADSTSSDRCSECGGCPSYTAPHNYYVQGFDDLLEYDYSKYGFVGVDLPLVSDEDKISRLCSLLSGVVTVRVGYKQWNQCAIDSGVELHRAPKLAGLYVTSVCRVFYDGNGVRPVECERCGKIRPYFKRVTADYSVQRTSWSGDDLFLLEGMFQGGGTIITQCGLDILRAEGFDNLKLIELFWVD